MSQEIARRTAEWLARDDDGVNDRLAALEYFDGEDEPAPVTVVEQTKEGWVARGRTPRSVTEDGPKIAVSIYSENWLPEVPTGQEQDGTVEVLVRYIAAANAKSEVQARDESYTMRATKQSLNRFHRCDDKALTGANGLDIVGVAGIRGAQLETGQQDARLSSGWIITYNVRDANPLGD